MTMLLDDPTIEGIARHPVHRGFSDLPSGDRVVSASGENPFCGDELEMRIVLARESGATWRVVGAAFDGYGCNLCLAGAEVIADAAIGLEASRAALLTGDDTCRLLGGLEVGRTRRGCVDLGARILGRALASVV